MMSGKVKGTRYYVNWPFTWSTMSILDNEGQQFAELIDRSNIARNLPIRHCFPNRSQPCTLCTLDIDFRMVSNKHRLRRKTAASFKGTLEDTRIGLLDAFCF